MTNGRIGELSVFDTPALIAAALADAFAGGARTAAEQRGTFNVALAGGTTPKAAYDCSRKTRGAASSTGIRFTSFSAMNAAYRRTIPNRIIKWLPMHS